PAWPARRGCQRPWRFSTMKVPLRVPTRTRDAMNPPPLLSRDSTATQGLQDEHFGLRADRIGQTRAIGDAVSVDDTVDVRAQAAGLVADVDRESLGGLFDCLHDCGDGRRFYRDRRVRERRNEGVMMAGEDDAGHPGLGRGMPSVAR